MNLSDGRLRVVMIGGYPADNNKIRGGVQAATVCLVNSLTKLNRLELHVISTSQNFRPEPDCIQQNGLTIHFLPRFPRFERIRDYRTYQAIFNRTLHLIQPAVVHAQEASADAYVALRSGYPTLVTVHGIRIKDARYCQSFRQSLRFYFDGLITERYVMRHVRHLIAISRYVTDFFSPLLRHDLDVHYLSNSIDERFFGLNEEPISPTVLFAGRVIPLKRVMELVQAFSKVASQLPDVQLRIAGECSSEPSYVDAIKRWGRHYGIEKQIHWLGELSQDDILREYAQCTMVALPSSQENAPMVLAQAMAVGKPMVATRVGGIVEMLGRENERGLLVEVNDVDALAEAILRLFSDEGLRTRLGQKGRAYALEHYHPDQVAQCTYDIYQHISAKQRPLNG